ncbi:MAG: tyrosine--tRNA ligase [Dehalococcoidia bacterium]
MTGSKIDYILRRGVAEIIIESEFRELLASGKTLTLKQGFDPSAPDIHLGHVVGLRKLRQLQELGHKVTLIVGDWTARIGDPSGQSATRPMLSPSQIESNAQTYMEQFFKVVDKDKTELRWQTEWFSSFTLDEIIDLTSRFTVAQLLAREDFSNRYSSGNPISLTEMLYPLLQSYDSVAVAADVEFGGTDQTFNCLLGREMQESMGQRPQQVFLVPLLVGTDGKQKMSKSLKNHIGIAEPPDEVYGKVMSIPDHLILDYFQLVTDVPEEEIAGFRQQMQAASVNPMNLKKRLAHEIVQQFHDKKEADEAEERFAQTFQKRQLPEETHTIELSNVSGTSPRTGLTVGAQWSMIDLMVENDLAKSRSEAARLLAQGAVEINGRRVTDSLVTLTDGAVIRVGKRRFLKVSIAQE